MKRKNKPDQSINDIMESFMKLWQDSAVILSQGSLCYKDIFTSQLKLFYDKSH